MSRIHEALNRAANVDPSASDQLVEPAGDAVHLFELDQPEGPAPPAQAVRHESTALRAPAPAAPARPVVEPPRLFDFSDDTTERLVVSSEIPAAAREQYQRLAARLERAQADHGIAVLLVVSATEGAGATLTATNLAVTLSEAYRRQVLIIDGDLHQPAVHRLLGLEREVNVGERGPWEEPLRFLPLTDHLSILTVAHPSVDQLTGLASTRLRPAIEQARREFDWVIVDAAPVERLPDAKVLASIADVVLLVAFADRTTYDVCQAAVDAIGADRIFGVVLNGVSNGAMGPFPAHRGDGPIWARMSNWLARQTGLRSNTRDGGHSSTSLVIRDTASPSRRPE
jgi:Mrp family chromosome partitioning ATPase